MGLTLICQLEPCGRLLLVRVEFKPQRVGSGGEGQALHGRARVRAEHWRRAVPTVVHLVPDKKERGGYFCYLR